MVGFVLGYITEAGKFNLKIFLLVLACMIFARSAAMAFNRFIDRNFDAKNPRTAMREIPAGTISASAALLLVFVCSLGFVISTYFINPLCFALSPVALIVVLGYSLTKRFTALCHLVLGLGLALAPIGAYIALTSQFAVLPLLFSFMVFFWVSGFDIIYALQDDEFDKSQSLKSIPVYLGRKNALNLSRLFHMIVSLLVLAAYVKGHFSIWYMIGAVIFILLLIYQHKLVKPTDLSKVTLAFGTTNGVASVLFCFFVCVDLLSSRI